jgi:hypothetical protein
VSQRRRRRSRDVTLVAVPVLAAIFTGCGSNNDTAYCVDKSDRIVENRNCDDDAVRGGSSFFWLYGAHGSSYVPGTRLSGGSRVAASNIAENARRGGFGSSSGTKSSGVGRAAAHSSSGGG